MPTSRSSERVWGRKRCSARLTEDPNHEPVPTASIATPEDSTLRPTSAQASLLPAILTTSLASTRVTPRSGADLRSRLCPPGLAVLAVTGTYHTCRNMFQEQCVADDTSDAYYSESVSSRLALINRSSSRRRPNVTPSRWPPVVAPLRAPCSPWRADRAACRHLRPQTRFHLLSVQWLQPARTSTEVDHDRRTSGLLRSWPATSTRPSAAWRGRHASASLRLPRARPA